MSIWNDCMDAVQPALLAGNLVRLVESQEQIATNTLVDNLEEQALLEKMLESSKPRMPRHAAPLHYLLSTPFRYPPLKHGSRFGSRHEPGIFYASRELRTVCAETAYYRFVFWSGMSTPPPRGNLVTEHTAFAASYATERGLCLDKEPFLPHADVLSSPESYVATQILGTIMRETGIEGFRYRSARDPDNGLNIGLYTAAAFTRPEPLWQQRWICDTREDSVSFYSKEKGALMFGREQFLVNGKLPAPAL